jgi:GTPase SAR1 family protein
MGIWDTAGSERYEAMSRIYYRSAKAAIICFDLLVPDDFEKVREWVGELKEQEPACALYIVGCKLDLVDPTAAQSRIDPALVRNYAQQVGAHVFETSAKTGRNVDELFFTIAENWLKQERRARTIANASGAPSNNVDIGRPAACRLHVPLLMCIEQCVAIYFTHYRRSNRSPPN